MQQLAERLSGFAAALLDPTLAVPLGLVGPDREASAKRFAVYRNNVVVGLTEALQANFPVVRRIVGDEFFQAMARSYVAFEPPASPILLDYGGGFANFIAAFEPAASLPYLPDVARIERAWTEAYHAPEAVPLGRGALSSITSDRVADTCFTVHPSVRIVRSRFPVLTIWRMNVDDSVPGPVDLEVGGEDVLLLRPAAAVEVRLMPSGGEEFLAGLMSGKSLTEAAKSAMNAHSLFDLSANLAALISAGIFVSHSVAEDAAWTETEAVGA
jgi:hypothetical protein